MSARIAQNARKKLCQLMRNPSPVVGCITPNWACQIRSLRPHFVTLVLTNFRCQFVTSLRVFGMLVVFRK